MAAAITPVSAGALCAQIAIRLAAEGYEVAARSDNAATSRAALRETIAIEYLDTEAEGEPDRHQTFVHVRDRIALVLDYPVDPSADRGFISALLVADAVTQSVTEPSWYRSINTHCRYLGSSVTDNGEIYSVRMTFEFYRAQALGD